MKLYIENTILGNKVINNPKFIPRVGEYIVFNKFVSRKVTSVTYDYGTEEIINIETDW